MARGMMETALKNPAKLGQCQSCQRLTHVLIRGMSGQKLFECVLIILMCMIFFTHHANAQASPKSLSKNEVIKLLKNYVPPTHVGELAEERGIGFAMTPE